MDLELRIQTTQGLNKRIVKEAINLHCAEETPVPPLGEPTAVVATIGTMPDSSCADLTPVRSTPVQVDLCADTPSFNGSLPDAWQCHTDKVLHKSKAAAAY